MEANECNDPVLELLAGLPAVNTSVTSDQEVRSRCHIALAHRAKLEARPTQTTTLRPRLFCATLGITAGLYAVAVAVEALRLAGVL